MNALAFVQNNVATFTNDSIEAEVSSLVEETRNGIGRFEATDDWLAATLPVLPVVVEGNVIVQYTDNRGFNQTKRQSLSDSLWTIAIKQVQYHLAVNYDLLAAAFTNWINDNVYTSHIQLGREVFADVETTVEEMMPTAKEYLKTMQVLSIIDTNLVKRVVRLQAGNNITSKVYEITAAFTEELNTIIDTLREGASMKCKPLEFMPNDWTDMHTGIAEGAGIKLVKKSKVKTKTIAPAVLSAVNKLQRVKFRVAPCMIEAARDMTMNKSLFTQEMYKKRYFSDKEVNAEAFDLYSELLAYADGEFFFPVTLDSRGRMYYRGGLLSPQGTDFCKAAFQFATAAPLGAQGYKAIAIHIANVCGLGGASIQERVDWVEDNYATIVNIKSHRDIRKNFKGADVFQALVACTEFARLAKLDGAWEDKTSNLVCHQDGTCNGLQHMAAITGDRPTAQAVNCVASSNTDKPADVYKLIADAAHKLAEGSVAELIQQFGRDMAKNPVMVTSYGAAPNTVKSNTAKYLGTKGEDASLGEDVGQVYIDAITEQAGAVTQLTEAITTRVQFAVSDGMRKFTWRTADGFLASSKYEDDEDMVVRVGLFHVRKRNMGQAPLDARKTAQAMTPNFVHSIDATHLRMVVNQCDHELVTVHDSIGSRPCDFFTTAKAIRENFAKVHNDYDALADLCNNMKQPLPEFPRNGDYNAAEALQSAYIFS